MINSIHDSRIKNDNGYHLTLEMSDQSYLEIFDDVNSEAATHIVDVFLNHYQDDGRPKEIDIKHDKLNRIVKIEAQLTYEGNDHTKQFMIPNHLR